MNILCVCQAGNSRSAALAWELKGLGHNAVPIGWQVNRPEPMGMLSYWADCIIIMQRAFLQYIPQHVWHKVMVYDVGEDRWVNPTHPELRHMVREFIKRFPPLDCSLAVTTTTGAPKL